MSQKKRKNSFILIGLLTAILAALFFLARSCDLLPAGFGEGARRGPSRVSIDKSKGYRLLTDGKPWLIRGVCYNPVPAGKGGDYNFWGDVNRPWIADGKLMKRLGVNTVRFYRPGKNSAQVKQVLGDLHRRFGIHTILGTYLGFWDWPPPNYTDEEFREKVLSEFLEMVRLYKDCPGVLFWVIGNENNYSFDLNVQPWSSDAIDALPDAEARRLEKARIYYAFVNSIAKEVKKIDPNHPVALGVGEVRSLAIAKTECPDIDLLGMIAYRGPGFGNLFRQIKDRFDIPVAMIEWGADSYNAATQEPDEEMQAQFIKQQWLEIEENADPDHGLGNCLGGTVFEWSDEWWKGNENLPPTWFIHDTAGHWQNASYHIDAYGPEKKNMNEEWWGLVSLDPKRKTGGLDGRVPKKSYEVLRSFWEKKP